PRVVSVARHVVEALFGEIAVPVGVIAGLQSFIKRSRFGDLAGAFAVTSGPVRCLAPKIRIVSRVDSDMFSQEPRRLGKVLRFVGLPGNVKLRGCDLDVAGGKVDGGAV